MKNKIALLLAGFVLGIVFSNTIPNVMANSDQDKNEALQKLVADQEKLLQFLKKQKKFTYKLVLKDVAILTERKSQNLLNSYGKKGWEFIGARATSIPNEIMFIFKKESR